MARTVVRVEGFKELEAALEELPKATAKNCLRRALQTAALPIVMAAKIFAPFRTGRLRRSIGVSKIKFTAGAAGKRAFAEAMAGGATRQEAGEAAAAANAGADDSGITSAVIVIGPGRSRYAGMQEFGTVKHRPHAYMRPAWDGHSAEALELIKLELKTEIEKAAARLARKAARDLAKSA